MIVVWWNGNNILYMMPIVAAFALPG